MKAIRRARWRLLGTATILAVLATQFLSDRDTTSAQPKGRQTNGLLRADEAPNRAQVGPPESLRAILCSANAINAANLRRWSTEGVNSVVLMATPEPAQDLRAAIRQIRTARMELYYWLEVARDPTLAAAHPEWMTSLQGHPEWRPHFPKFPEPKNGEVVRNSPWVPIVYQEAFDSHLQRISGILKSLPNARGIFLNDL